MQLVYIRKGFIIYAFLRIMETKKGISPSPIMTGILMVVVFIVAAGFAYTLFSEMVPKSSKPTSEINLTEVNLSECIYKKPIYIYNYTIREFSSKKEARKYANRCKEKGGLVGVCGISFLSDNLSVVCVKRNIAYSIYYCDEGIFAVFDDGTIKPLNTDTMKFIDDTVESFLEETQHEPFFCNDVRYVLLNFNRRVLEPVNLTEKLLSFP